jgi:hypothetical protein
MNTKTENSSAQASWFVGASYGGTDDQLPRFLSEGIWENGYEDKHLDVVRSMRPGEAFAEHVLGVKASAHKIKSPTLDLSMLRTGFDVPEVFEDGFSMVQLKALTLLSPDTALKIECTAMHSSQQRSVHDLLKEKLPGPLEGQWAVTAAQVNLYYPPEPGRTRPKVVTIEVTSKGRLNLHKFDAKMQAQLEGYLVAVGILQKGQTLSAQELPPETDAVSSSSAYED